MEKLVYVANTSSTASGPLDVFEENSTVACDMLPKGEGFGEITAALLGNRRTYGGDRCNLGPPRTSVPTNEIEILLSAKDGCAAVTDTTLDRRQLVAQQVAGTHGPYKFDIIFMFRQQTNARRYAFLHPTHPPQAFPSTFSKKTRQSLRDMLSHKRRLL